MTYRLDQLYTSLTASRNETQLRLDSLDAIMATSTRATGTRAPGAVPRTVRVLWDEPTERERSTARAPIHGRQPQPYEEPPPSYHSSMGAGEGPRGHMSSGPPMAGAARPPTNDRHERGTKPPPRGANRIGRSKKILHPIYFLKTKFCHSAIFWQMRFVMV